MKKYENVFVRTFDGQMLHIPYDKLSKMLGYTPEKHSLIVEKNGTIGFSCMTKKEIEILYKNVKSHGLVASETVTNIVL